MLVNGMYTNQIGDYEQWSECFYSLLKVPL